MSAGRRLGMRSQWAISCGDVMSRRWYDRDMADARPWSWLHDLAADQFGLFTSAQAEARGISHDELHRRTDSGRLFSAHPGVYGFSDAAADMLPYTDWAATWLALNPDRDIASRRCAPDFIVSHDSAASIRELGTVVSYGLYLTGSQDIAAASGLSRIHFYQRDIGVGGVDWDLVEGLPVATPSRIITDLAADRIDGSHLGTVIADVVEEGLLTISEVSALLAPFASHWSEPSGVALAVRFAHDAGRALRAPV